MNTGARSMTSFWPSSVVRESVKCLISAISGVCGAEGLMAYERQQLRPGTTSTSANLSQISCQDRVLGRWVRSTACGGTTGFNGKTNRYDHEKSGCRSRKRRFLR